MPDVISHIQTFRDYFHYHIKASKAYIHSRMRKRTADFLQGECARLLTMSWMLIIGSSASCPTRERRAGEEDGKRQDIQGPGQLKALLGVHIRLKLAVFVIYKFGVPLGEERCRRAINKYEICTSDNAPLNRLATRGSYTNTKRVDVNNSLSLI